MHVCNHTSTLTVMPRPFKHGLSAYRRAGEAACRCPVCREAHRAYSAQERAARYAQRVMIDGRLVYPAVPERHGRPGGSLYNSYGCRCEPCTKAFIAKNSDYKKRRAEWQKIIREMAAA